MSLILHHIPYIIHLSMFTSINPYTQTHIKSYRADSASVIERKHKQADRAFADWSALSLLERTDHLDVVTRKGQINDQKGNGPIRRPVAKKLFELNFGDRNDGFFVRRSG